MAKDLKLQEGEEFFGEKIPTDKERMGLFLYEYTSTMEECIGGEIPLSIYVTHIDI